MKTYYLLISGKVQGVFYRASAKKVAEEMDINGWIKNTPDGCVEAIISGDPSSIEAFISWCKSGPHGSDVENVIVTQREFSGFTGFKIIREK